LEFLTADGTRAGRPCHRPMPQAHATGPCHIFKKI
jgi:hypothetical protein